MMETSRKVKWAKVLGRHTISSHQLILRPLWSTMEHDSWGTDLITSRHDEPEMAESGICRDIDILTRERGTRDSLSSDKVPVRLFFGI